MQDLFKYQWPGNVRELGNNIHSALVKAKGDKLDRDDFPAFDSEESTPENQTNVLETDYTDSFDKLIKPIMPQLIQAYPGKIYHMMEAAFEKAVISACLEYYNGNQVKASETLGISRNTLRDRISRFEIY